MTEALATIAAVYAALHAAHLVGDHWVQSDWQALHKGDKGWTGRVACALHVTDYIFTSVVALGLLSVAAGWVPDPWRLTAGLAVSAVTHYWADRRTPLRRLAEILPTTRHFWTVGAPREGRDDQPHLGTGAYHLDQSWHVAWIFVAALIIGGGQ